MKKGIIVVGIVAGLGICGLATPSRAGHLPTVRPETLLGFSQTVEGTATVAVLTQLGCPTQDCSTNMGTAIVCSNIVIESQTCFTNEIPILTCTTNFTTVIHCLPVAEPMFIACVTNSAGELICTNRVVPIPVCITNTVLILSCTTNGFQTVVHCLPHRIVTEICFTNSAPQLVCTNDFGTNSILRVRETVMGPVAATGCDELGAFLPSNSVFNATFLADVRQSDWRGVHNGVFTITSGGVTIMAGTLSGTSGVETHGAVCALCNHFEGILHGSLLVAGPLRNARVQANYAGDFPDVTCPSTNIPQGAVELTLDGVAILPNCLPVIDPPTTARPRQH